MNHQSEQQSRRRWLLLVEICSVVGAVLAILAFVGYPTMQSLAPSWACGVIRCAPPPPSAPSPSPSRPSPTLPEAGTFPQPQTWRPPSNLAGESWILNLGDRQVRFDFKGDSSVFISDPEIGGDGRWTSLGRNQVRIETPSRTIMGTMTTDGDGMAATIYRSDAQNRAPQPEYSSVFLRRIH